MGIFLWNILNRPVWICVSGFSWQQLLGERGQMSHCGALQWYIPLLLSHWKWNKTGSSVMQIWTDTAISCVTLWGKRVAEGNTHHPPFPHYKHFLHSSSRWDNEYTKEQSLLYKWKQIYKITSLIDKYNKYFMHHNSGQLHLKQVCWQVTKKLRPRQLYFSENHTDRHITM